MAKRIDHSVKSLNIINQRLNKIQDVDLLLERILQIARKEVNADAGTVYVREGDMLAFRHSQNETFRKNLKPGEKLAYTFFKLPINEKSITGFVAEKKKALNIPDMYAISKKAPYSFNPRFDKETGYKTVSSLTFPLVSTDDDLLGVLQLINARGPKGTFVPFDPEVEEFLQAMADKAVDALQRAQMTRNLLERMVEFSRLRDPKETGPHVNRVGYYSMEIYEAWARQRNIDEEERERNRDLLRLASMLHDVGKVGISDVILKKPGRFDNHERRIMMSHTWVGARVFLGKPTELDKLSMEVALRHHERWDGKGYPGKIDLETADDLVLEVEELPPGLEGEEIPLFARIVGLADVFDALCSKRVYKEAWAEEDVLETIREESGKQFDPEMVEIFFRILPRLRSIRQMYPDDD